jgi:nuclear GTP-binding protein
VDITDASASLLKTSECLGAETLMQLLKNYARNAGIKTAIRVGVIGFPNTGKSSVINSLKRSKVCQVGNVPGVTKSTQEVSLDKHIKLLDCPGIVFSKPKADGSDSAEVLLRNCVKVALVEDPISPVELIMKRCSPQQLMKQYQLTPFVDVRDFLLQLAKQRGRLKRGGIPDLEATARIVLMDWNAGRIPYYTVPPARQSHEVASSVVETWSKEFALSSVVQVEDEVLNEIKTKNEMGKLLKVDGMSVDVDFDSSAYQFDDAMDVEESGEEFAEESGEESEDGEDFEDFEESEESEKEPVPQKAKVTDVFNQQHGKMTKQQLKKQKKQQRRMEQALESFTENQSGEDSDFDFEVLQ